MYKVREFPDKNYRAIYFNGKTIRIAINPDLPIEELDYPEFYDIKLTGKCNAFPLCSYCYQDSTEDQQHYDAIGQLEKFFGSMTENQRPLQIAYGGGSPTTHPDFKEIMALTRRYGIAPNYTTNGMFLHDPYAKNVLDATMEYCEGVAVTCHKHLDSTWRETVDVLTKLGVFTNLHILLDDREESFDYFKEVFKKYAHKIQYAVILPMIDQGRASGRNTNMDVLNNHLMNTLESFKMSYDLRPFIPKVAFGAMLYPELKSNRFYGQYNLSLYEPEIFSRYLDLKDGAMYNSSFDTKKPIGKLI